jgi:hypothetical protein
MRPVLALLLLATLSAAAQASRGPAPEKRLTPSPADWAMFVGPAGAMLESDYFRAPAANLAGDGLFPCKLDLDLLAKARLAATCH